MWQFANKGPLVLDKEGLLSLSLPFPFFLSIFSRGKSSSLFPPHALFSLSSLRKGLY